MTSKPQVVVTHRIFPETVLLLKSVCEPVLNQTAETLPRGELLRRTRDAAGLIAFMPDRVDAMFVANCRRLRVIAGALKGCDNFDVDACTRHGVWLTVVPDLLTVPTAELAIGLMIGLARNIREGDRRVRNGSFTGWRPELYGAGIAGSTVGIVGMGNIGRAIARRLAGFEAKLVYTDATPLPTSEEARLGLARASLDALLRVSDFVILAVPLNPSTHHLICDETIDLMKPGALLVNPCRGSVVDEMAVAVALVDGRLGGYAADVFEFEDWALTDRPREVTAALRAMPGETLFTPHLGSAVMAARRAIERAAAENIIAVLRGGRPAGAVNEPAFAPVPVVA